MERSDGAGKASEREKEYTNREKEKERECRDRFAQGKSRRENEKKRNIAIERWKKRERGIHQQRDVSILKEENVIRDYKLEFDMNHYDVVVVVIVFQFHYSTFQNCVSPLTPPPFGRNGLHSVAFGAGTARGSWRQPIGCESSWAACEQRVIDTPLANRVQERASARGWTREISPLQLPLLVVLRILSSSVTSRIPCRRIGNFTFLTSFE